uniref:Dehydrogenase/reductase SDR family member 4 n=1 Tax=Cercocebus atys TaxID=9531 RepID=A0A2K5N0D0_CERAT
MQKAGLLGHCVPAWKSVRMASSQMTSSRMTRRDLLANKVALVRASTDRIGFAIARRLAQDGAHVVVNSWKQQNVDQAVATLQGEGLSVTGTVCHVGKIEDPEWLVATAVKLHGGIDILVSNAAVSPVFGSLMDITKEVWDKLCKDKEKEERMKEILQIRRLGEPEDCAGIVSFLRSEDASYITGETVVVGGGTPSRL